MRKTSQPADTRHLPAQTVAEALLAQMGARGIDYLFANAGTDFPSIIEAYARAGESQLALPAAIAVPHENVAVAMAHGHYLGSGRMQAVMVHVSVGLANSLCGLINAARENVPLFLMAGRTPLTESGHMASRDVSIHWGQEMFDQAAMLRELVKWDYELRGGAGLETVVDRAIAIARSDPGGPVYLGLPRESLAEPLEGFAIAEPSRLQPARAVGVDPGAVDEAARLLAAAEAPLIVAARAGRDPALPGALAEFADLAAIPVVEYRANYVNLAADHPMHAGFDFAADFAAHDLVLVLDTPAPWLPSRHAWPQQAKVVQISPDPLSQDIPVRGFPCDLAIAARPAAALPLLGEAFRRHAGNRMTAIAARRERLAAHHRDARAAREARLLPESSPSKLTAAWASRCLDRVRGRDSIVVNELGCLRPLMRFTDPGSYFGPSNAGGLGWGIPASLGLKLAQPERRVIACVGDGSCMFANPVACLQVAAAQSIATLTIVFNNRRWEAVRTATRSVIPDGHAMRANSMPLVSLEPSPAFEQVAAACGGYGERVERAEALPAALERALARVDAGEPALLNLLLEE